MERHQGFFSVLKEEMVRGLSPGRSRRARTRSPSPSGSGQFRRRRASCCRENMERQQGFFSVLKEEMVRGLSPGRSRRARTRSPSPSGSGPLRRRRASSLGPSETSTERSVNSREGPDPDPKGSEPGSPRSDGWANWLRRAPSVSASGLGLPKSDVRLLLGLLGAPLGPVHVSNSEPWPHLCIKHNPIECCSAQYILHQYLAASGGHKLQNSIQNVYATGNVKMLASDLGVIKSKIRAKAAESGFFVLCLMNPDMWYVELALGGSKIRAGCDGRIVWRHTPWIGAHAAKGHARPLRRALQGLDPRTTANMFAGARCTGENKINGEDCFVLKLSADVNTLKSRSEGPAEVVRHAMFGYFSQKTGLLMHLEDSHLTRIQANGGGDAVYWETTISSSLDSYRLVEGVLIAHSGQSVATLFRFGETPMSHTKTRIEESWAIEEVAFNIMELSADCFIPPAELGGCSDSEALKLPRERVKTAAATAAYRAKVTALGDRMNDVVKVSR